MKNTFEECVKKLNKIIEYLEIIEQTLIINNNDRWYIYETVTTLVRHVISSMKFGYYNNYNLIYLLTPSELNATIDTI